MKPFLLIVLFLTAGLHATEVKDSELAMKVNDIADTRKFLGVDAYSKFYDGLSSVKVAVLDKGFKGIHPAREDGRRFLPKSAEVIDAYAKATEDVRLDDEDPHGTHMAHLIWAMTGYQEEGPKFRLYNANGPENFLLAVEDLLKWKPDVVVFSQNWETFGNFDGTGFIDQAVKEVTDEGIIWLNAAGNDGGNIYNGPVNLVKTENDDQFLKFDSKSDNTWYLRFKNLVDENQVTITLSWNSFDPGYEAKGTDKDLDLSLFVQQPGAKSKRLATSKLTQTKEKTGKEDETIHARERISVTLPADKDNYYLLAVNAKDADKAALFDPKKDRIRVTIRGNKGSFYDEDKKKNVGAIDFVDATDTGEIPVPADGSGLAVGDLTANSAKGPTVDGRGKPDIIMQKNNVTFSDRQGFFGTSYANAYLGGIVALLRAAEPRTMQEDLLKFRIRYPLQYLADQVQAQGWAISDVPVIDPVLATYIQEKWGIDYLVMAGPGGRTAVASSESVDKLSSWPKEVMDNLKDYFLYARAKRIATTKRERVPKEVEVIVKAGYHKPTTKRELQKVLVKQGGYVAVPRTKTVNYGGQFVGIDWVRGTIGTYQPQLTLYYTENKYVEPEYDYKWVDVPGEPEWVPPVKKMETRYVYADVPGEDKVEKEFRYQKKKDAEWPWEKWGGLPGDYVEIIQLPEFSFIGKGAVVDGSAKSPRIWSTPSFEKLQRVVRAREIR